MSCAAAVLLAAGAGAGGCCWSLLYPSVVLGIRDMTAGPSAIASIKLPLFLPLGLHGMWTSRVLGADGQEQALRSILEGV